jgi:DNA-binding protein HU-beta
MMNKTELVKAIAAKAKFKLSDTEKLVNAFIETVSEELKDKGKVTLVGFGTFGVAHRKEKTAINPKTGEKITIKAKMVPVFKPAKALKEMVKDQAMGYGPGGSGGDDDD